MPDEELPCYKKTIHVEEEICVITPMFLVEGFPQDLELTCAIACKSAFFKMV
jgi:hypothetical protein